MSPQPQPQQAVELERYRALFETMDEGFCVIEFFDGPHGPNSDYVHVLANPAYERNAGIPNVVGQKLREMVPDEADGWVELYGSVLRTGTPIRFQRELVATGRHLEVSSFRLEPVTLRQVAVLFKDVSDRARAETELRRLNETLEARVAAAVDARAKIEDALRQSQKMEAVGQLTGGLAHDFNNLLAGISGSLELAQMRINQGRLGDVEKYLLTAQGATRRAAALTHRLLAFARRQTLLPRPVNVNRLVAGMIELIQRTVGPGIAIENVAATGLWTAHVDASQLENALLNLCINARDAMPGGGRITIETCNRWIDAAGSRQLDMPEGQYLSLCVSDTGTGMTPEIRARAFDPFFTTKPIGEGTGLGLSMIYGFAKQSGGQVRIYSEPDQGTMVCVYLPRHLGDDEPELPALEPAVPVPAGAGETVLVVDDEPSVRLLIVDVLHELGYAAIEAADGAAGMRVFDSGARIDLLVTDVGLPGGMNGRQLADAARASRPDLHVLFITGFAENALLNNGQLEPGMAVLTKPFAIDALATRIRHLIRVGD